jgi:hypothetical protein
MRSTLLLRTVSLFLVGLSLLLPAGLWAQDNRNPNAVLSPNLESRPKVTVYYFSFTEGRSNFTDAQALSQVVENDFVQTKRFLMIERQKLGQLSEVQLQDEVLVENVVHTGKLVGVDYVILGHINSLTITPQTSYGGGMVTTYYTPSMNVMLKLLDVNTGVILATEEVNYNPFYGAASADQAKANAFNSVDQKVKEMIGINFPLVFRVHELDVVKKKTNQVKFLTMLGGNEDGVMPGDIYNVVLEEVIPGYGIRRKQIGSGFVVRLEGPNAALCKIEIDGALGQKNLIKRNFDQYPGRIKMQQAKGKVNAPAE